MSKSPISSHHHHRRKLQQRLCGGDDKKNERKRQEDATAEAHWPVLALCCLSPSRGQGCCKSSREILKSKAQHAPFLLFICFIPLSLRFSHFHPFTLLALFKPIVRCHVIASSIIISLFIVPSVSGRPSSSHHA